MNPLRAQRSADGQIVQTIRPEACGASFQTSEREHPQAFLYFSIVESTFHYAEANGFETTDCLECLQILNILYMAGIWQMGATTMKLDTY